MTIPAGSGDVIARGAAGDDDPEAQRIAKEMKEAMERWIKKHTLPDGTLPKIEGDPMDHLDYDTLMEHKDGWLDTSTDRVAQVLNYLKNTPSPTTAGMLDAALDAAKGNMGVATATIATVLGYGGGRQYAQFIDGGLGTTGGPGGFGLGEDYYLWYGATFAQYFSTLPLPYSVVGNTKVTLDSYGHIFRNMFKGDLDKANWERHRGAAKMKKLNTGIAAAALYRMGGVTRKSDVSVCGAKASVKSFGVEVNSCKPHTLGDVIECKHNPPCPPLSNTAKNVKVGGLDVIIGLT